MESEWDWVGRAACPELVEGSLARRMGNEGRSGFAKRLRRDKGTRREGSGFREVPNQESVDMETVTRIVENLIGRLDGPFHFRIILQPVMALIFAAIDGVRDAKAGKPAYFWAMLTSPGQRKELWRDGWKRFGKIFILAIVLDVVYQWKVNHHVYPGETLLVALVLAVIPYVLMRGPVNRLLRMFVKKPSKQD